MYPSPSFAELLPLNTQDLQVDIIYLRSLWPQDLRDGWYFETWSQKSQFEQGTSSIHTSKQQDSSSTRDKRHSPNQDQGIPPVLHCSEALAGFPSFGLAGYGIQRPFWRIFLSWREKGWSITGSGGPAFKILAALQVRRFRCTKQSKTNFADLPSWWRGSWVSKATHTHPSFSAHYRVGCQKASEHHQVPLALHYGKFYLFGFDESISLLWNHCLFYQWNIMNQI